MKINLEREPAQVIAYLTAAVTAVLGLLVAYGIDISDEQQTAILGVVAVVAPIVAGLLIRGNVYAPDTHDRDVDAAAGTRTARGDAVPGRERG